MGDEQMFTEAIEAALAAPASEEVPVEIPEEVPVDEVEEAPEEEFEGESRAAEELFVVVFGLAFNPESENHQTMMEQVVEKMADPEYQGLNSNQFALKMFRDTE